MSRSEAVLQKVRWYGPGWLSLEEAQGCRKSEVLEQDNMVLKFIWECIFVSCGEEYRSQMSRPNAGIFHREHGQSHAGVSICCSCIHSRADQPGNAACPLPVTSSPTDSQTLTLEELEDPKRWRITSSRCRWDMGARRLRRLLGCCLSSL